MNHPKLVESDKSKGSGGLGALVIVMVIILIIAGVVIGFFVYRYLMRKKRRASIKIEK